MPKSCIFAKTEILSVLQVLDREYRKVYRYTTPQGPRLMKAYSKMAAIALSGWLEDGIKDLMGMSGSKLHELDNQNMLSDMAKGIHGFSYDRHFSKGLVLAFGIHGYEYVEANVGDTDIAKLKSVLGNLKQWRDDAAHSHSTVISCDPSRIITSMNDIFPILKKIEIYTRKYRDLHF